MQVTIKHITDLQGGIYINTKAVKGDVVYYLQVNDWNKEKNWSEHTKPQLPDEEKLRRHYLVAGDILLATKGTDHTAVLYDSRYAPAIASSVFTVLRIKDQNQVLPAYLQWYLNHPHVQKQLSSAAKGTSMPLITRDIIEELLLPMLPLEKQAIILQAFRLHVKAKHIRQRIDNLEESLFHHQLFQKAIQ
jgi:restriction endonuclease S subunit